MSSYDEEYLPFWEHLEVLRWHIIRSTVAILSITFVAFSARNFVFHTLVLGPARPTFWTYRVLCRLGEWICSPSLCIQNLPFTLQSRQLAGQFTAHVLASLMLGLMGAFPYVLWELWCFFKPSISPKNYKVVYGSILIVSLLFTLGVLFGYYIVTPLIIYFLANYQVDSSIVNRFDIVSYVSTVFSLTLACAFMFQLPVVIYFLARIGIVTAHNMRTYRRHTIVSALILAAIITPPDVMSQLLIATPLVVLYEFSILIAQFVENRHQVP